MFGNKKSPTQGPAADARIMEDQEWQRFYDQVVQAADAALKARRSILLTIAAQSNLRPEHADSAKVQLQTALQADTDAEQHYESLKRTHADMLILFTEGRNARVSGASVLRLP